MVVVDKKFDFLWHDFSLKIGQTSYWRIGPLYLWIEAQDGELRVHTVHTNSLNDTEIEYVDHYSGEIDPAAELTRYSFSCEIEKVSFSPHLPEKDIIFRPDKPIQLPSKRQMSLYVNTSLWIHVKVNGNEILKSVPIVTLSETWLGPDSTHGEICFAAKTKGVLNYEDLKFYPYRYISKFTIKNETHGHVPIERIKLMNGILNLYTNEEGYFFSDCISMRIDSDGDVKIHTNKPVKEDFGILKKISPSRESGRNLISRALSLMIQS